MLGKAYRKVSFLSFSDFRLPIEIDEEEGQSPIEDREKTWERASNELPVGMTFFVRFDTRTTQNRISPIIRLVSELFYRNFIQYTRDCSMPSPTTLRDPPFCSEKNLLQSMRFDAGGCEQIEIVSPMKRVK